MMDELKDYVFYIVLRNDNYLWNIGYNFGIKKGIGKYHEAYFDSFLGLEPSLLDGDSINPNSWPDTMENLARGGDLIFVNSSVEFDDTNKSFFCIYLPSNPNLFQIIFLENHLEEFENINIDVEVFGKKEEIFNMKRQNLPFDSHKFLKKYVYENKKKFRSKQKVITK